MRRSYRPVVTVPPEMPRYSLYGIAVDSAIELAATPAGVTGVADCTVRFVDNGTIADVDWFHAWRFPRSAPSLMFGRMSGRYVLRVPGVADFTVSPDGTEVGLVSPSGQTIDTLQHLLADLVLPLAISRRGNLLLHAAAVNLPGVGAVAIAGESGRGKSSLSMALVARGASVLSDDCTVIDETAESMVAVPAYPGLRLWSSASEGASPRDDVGQTAKTRIAGSTVPFCSKRSPLTAIFVLSRRHDGRRLRVRRISHPGAVVELLRHTFVMDILDRVQLARVFDALTGLVARVPVLRLALPDDHAALPEAAESTIKLAQALVRRATAA